LVRACGAEISIIGGFEKQVNSLLCVPDCLNTDDDTYFDPVGPISNPCSGRIRDASYVHGVAFVIFEGERDGAG
jgi:hypothetical protein